MKLWKDVGKVDTFTRNRINLNEKLHEWVAQTSCMNELREKFHEKFHENLHEKLHEKLHERVTWTSCMKKLHKRVAWTYSTKKFHETKFEKKNL